MKEIIDEHMPDFNKVTHLQVVKVVDYSFIEIDEVYSAYKKIVRGIETEGIIETSKIQEIQNDSTQRIDAIKKVPKQFSIGEEDELFLQVHLVHADINNKLIDEGMMQRRELSSYIVFKPFTTLEQAKNKEDFLLVANYPQAGVAYHLHNGEVGRIFFPHSRVLIDGIGSYKRQILDLAISKYNPPYHLLPLINHLIENRDVVVGSTDEDSFERTNFYITFQIKKESYSNEFDFLTNTKHYFEEALGARHFRKENKHISLIVAKGKNGEIGLDNGLPWSIKEELAFFKEQTMGATLLVGRKTYETLPPLPGRKVLVLTTNKDKKENEVNSIEEAIIKSDERLIIAGGKTVYENTYHFANEFIITIIDEEFEEADTKLKLNLEGMELIKTINLRKGINRLTGKETTFTHYFFERTTK